MGATSNVQTAQSAGAAVRGLIIVSRDQPELWRALTHEFGRTREIRVILDRRYGERRQEAEFHGPDRRGIDRRSPHGADADLRARHYVLARPHYRLPKE